MRRAPVTVLSKRLWLALCAMALMLLLIGVLGLVIVYRSLDRVPRGAKLVASEVVTPPRYPVGGPGSADDADCRPGRRLADLLARAGTVAGGVSNEARWERLSTG